MPYPVTLNIGSATIHLHVFFEILAYTIGFRYYLFLRKNTHDLISDNDRLWIFIGAALGGFLGSHILGVLEKPIPLPKGTPMEQYFDLKLGLLYFMGNKTVLGGYLGGLIGVELTKKRLGVTTSSGDLMTFPLILALIIGRIGCHLEGLDDGTFGSPTTLPWGIDFGDNIFRHPTNLYEIFFLIILWLSIVYIEKPVPAKFIWRHGAQPPNKFGGYGLPNGVRFKIFLISYCIFRFFIEFLKPAYVHPIGLSSIQLVALGGVVYYILLKLKYRDQIN